MKTGIHNPDIRKSGISKGNISKIGILKRTILASLLILTLLPGQAFATAAALDRSQIDLQYQWNLKEIYSTTTAWNRDLKKVLEEYIPEMEKFKGKLDSAQNVYDWVVVSDKAFILMDKLYAYAYFKSDQNNPHGQYSELIEKSEQAYSRLNQVQALAVSEILSLETEKLQSLRDDPLLVDRKQAFDALIRQKAHMLSKSEEEILAVLSVMDAGPYTTYRNLIYGDMTFSKIMDVNGEETPVNFDNYGSLLDSSDRRTRKNAYESLLKSFSNVKNTLAASLAAEVEKNVALSKVRKYESALDAGLADEFIPRSVFDSLLLAVGDNLAPLHKYVSLRKKALGLDGVHLYDMFVPLTKDVKTEIPYEKAKEMIKKALEPLGEEYAKAVQTAFDDRWIDVYPTGNKHSGTYQWGSYATHPYILTNYDGTLQSVIDLSSVLGNALNQHFTNTNQSYEYSKVIFDGEVASGVNSLLIYKYLLENVANDDEKILLTANLINTIRGYMFTESLISEFEKTIHERVEAGEGLSAKTFSDIYGKLMEKYYGEDYISDEYTNLAWARFEEFYNAFTGFQYATAMSAANEIVKNLGTEGNEEKYLTFLKSGSSDYPVELLKKAGVDITATTAVDNMILDFGVLVDELGVLLEKKGLLAEEPAGQEKPADDSGKTPLTMDIAITPVAFTISPTLEDGVYMAPTRALAKTLGAHVEWDDAAKAILIRKGDTSIRVALGSAEALVNGSPTGMSAPVKVSDGTSRVDIKFLAEALGYKVTVPEGSNTIKVENQ